jgi:ABC-type nitrate/sulfonate/bicarbonate transport system substrate-binding protein
MSHPRALRTRRRLAMLAAIAAAGLALAGCAATPATDASDGAAFPLTLQTSWTPNVQFGGSYIAKTDGLYAAEGVDVTLAPGGPETDPIAMVVGGRALIGQSTADSVARANAAGGDLVMIGALYQKNPFAVMSLADKPIADPKAMVGKRIGVPSGDTATIDALLTANGLQPSDVAVVPVGYDIAPLTSGEVDGLVVFYTDQPVALQLAGFQGETFLMSDYGLDVYGQTYFVTRENLQKHRDQIEAFLRGEIAGWERYLQDPDYAAQLTVDDYASDVGLELEAQQIQAKRQIELIKSPATETHGLLWMSTEDIQANLATLAELGIAGASAAMFDNSLLEDIAGGSAK